MARVRTSLKERGRQILGLGRRVSAGEMSMGAGENPASRASSNGDACTVDSTVAVDADVLHEGTQADREREIDEMLRVEAKAATGEDAASARSARQSSHTGPLPESEWISPVSATGPRPVPAPPPIAARSPATSSSPPKLVAGPANRSLTSFSRPSLVERPSVSSAVAESVHPSVAPEEDDLLPMAQAGDPAGMEGGVGPPRSVKLTNEEETDMLGRQDVRERLADLDKNIQLLDDRIHRENASVNQDITNRCHYLLQEARVIVMYRELERLARAEWCVEQVRARLGRADDSRKQVRAPIRIIVWGVIWFILFGYLTFNPTWVLLRFNLGRLTDLFINPEIFVRTLFFGGIGGVAAMLYRLFRYGSDRSFDSKQMLSYFGKPFMGMLLGSMIFLTVFVAMRVLGLSPIGLPESNAETVTNVLFTGLLFVIAMTVGFKQDVACNLLNRVIRCVLRDDDAVKPRAATGRAAR